MSEVLGRINRQLSEENSKLQSVNERLEIENQRLRLELERYGNGRIVPISHNQDYISRIAQLKAKVKRLEERILKYEPLSITEIYGGKPNEKNSTTSVVSAVENKWSKSEALEEIDDTEDIQSDQAESVTPSKESHDSNEETSDYRPQPTVKVDSPLINKNRMRSEDIFNDIKNILSDEPLTKKNICDKTGYTDDQVKRALEVYCDKVIKNKDPQNRRRYLYTLA